MDNLKKWSKRSLMIFLFLAAFLTTIYSISGIEPITFIRHFHSGQNDQPNLVTTFAANVMKQVWPEKISASANDDVPRETPRTLEELDWSQYPKKEIIATGYTAGVESTGKYPGDPDYGITYSGVKVKRDLYSTIAADLDIFPIGTILFIPGYGYGVVADKGGAIRGNKIDLYYDTVEEVYSEWGKQTVEVSVIKMGKGKLTEEELEAMNEDESMQVFRQQYVRDKES